MLTNNNSDSERSALQLLQEINSGLIDPKLLDKQSRQQCIELLILEGYTYPQISQALKVSEKTIGRDVKEIKVHNELTPNIEFAKQTIGDLFQKGINHHSYLMRLARSKEASVSEKMQSEFAAWKVLKELIEKFQTLGYLPMKPTEVIGNFYHHSEDAEASPEDMRKTLLGLEQAAKEAGVFDEEVMKRVEVLNNRINQSEIAKEIKQLEQGTLNKEVNHEERS
jgi:hypothetical protein